MNEVRIAPGQGSLGKHEIGNNGSLVSVLVLVLVLVMFGCLAV